MISFYTNKMNLTSIWPPVAGFVWTMGTNEDLYCVKGISYFPVINDQGSEVKSCYAAMVSTENFIVPYKLHVSKYVIAEVNTDMNDAGETYYELSPEWRRELQSEGWLPLSLPTYQIGVGSYLPAIGLILVFAAYIAYAFSQYNRTSQKPSPEQEDGD